MTTEAVQCFILAMPEWLLGAAWTKSDTANGGDALLFQQLFLEIIFWNFFWGPEMKGKRKSHFKKQK